MQHLLENIRLARFRFHPEAVTPLQLPPYKTNGASLNRG
jgi:hypothetical protein